jgi:hypothetical protein
MEVLSFKNSYLSYAPLIVGKKTPEARKILGKRFKDEFIHRNNLALLK